MYYLKNINSTSKTNKTICISDFSGGIDTDTSELAHQTDKAIKCYNFSYKNGALTQTSGFKSMTLPRFQAYGTQELAVTYPSNITIKSVHYFKQYDSASGRIDKLLIYCSDNNVYYCRLNTYSPQFRTLNLTLTETPQSTNYKLNNADYILLSNTTEGLYVWDGENSSQHIATAPSISSLCVCADRLIACTGGDKTTIRYSTNKDITTWTQALQTQDAQITLNDEKGGINSLVGYLNYVYAFRDYGITRLSFNASSTPVLYQLYSSGSKIYGNTVKVCGNKILLFCKDGIYSFDGSNMKKIELNIDNLFDKIGNEYAVAEYHNGKYYLACRLSYNDNQTIGSESTASWHNNSLICLDVNTNEFDIIRGVDISSLVSVKFGYFDKLLASFNSVNGGYLGELSAEGIDFSTNQSKCWETPMAYWVSTKKTKVLNQITIDTKYAITLTVKTENGNQSFSISGSSVPQTIRTCIRGKKFGFSITSTAQLANISNLEFRLEY